MIYFTVSIKSRGVPFWNVLVLYGYCSNSFRLPPLSVKRANMGKKCSKPSWQAFCPYMEATHFKKGLPQYQSCSRRNLGCMALTETICKSTTYLFDGRYYYQRFKISFTWKRPPSSLSFGHSKPMQTSLAGVVSTFSPWVPKKVEMLF